MTNRSLNHAIRRARVAAAALTSALLVATSCDLTGPCPDNSSPPEGSCSCKDGTQIEARKCDVCDGTEPRDLGVLVDVEEVGSVISLCERAYDFSVSDNTVFQAELSKGSEGLSVTLQTTDSQTLGSTNVPAGSSGTLSVNLAPGAYRVLLRSGAAKASPFRLELHAVPHGGTSQPDPGSSQDQAFDLGAVGTLDRVSGYVGSTDSDDFYQFDVPRVGTLSYALTGVLGSVHLELFAAAPIVTANPPIGVLDARTGETPTLPLNLPRGRYFARVTARGVDSLYELRLSNVAYSEKLDEDAPEPSDDWTQADQLQEIGEIPPVSRVGYVGGRDLADYYRFEITKNSTLTYSLSSVRGRVRATRYKEVPLLDPAKEEEHLDSSMEPVNQSPKVEAGAYYMRVTSIDGAPALYTLSLSAAQ